ncbi:MAG: 50S ribosomal protein L4 [Candidatus Omnitrophica bacterium]|nr:50S ribosomal protein L4 [bacterium]NUN96678.1 50S ribosomal protein L4 [Candidatus Omnitrophota bacterium]
MPKAPLFRQDGSSVGEIDLPESVFGCEVRPGLIHQVVVSQRANQRQATKMTKNRSHVSGGGKKPWRQKGTGRARQGSIRAVQWVGGGRAFGNQTYNFEQDIPRKMKRGALRAALSQKCLDQAVLVVESIALPEIKTKAFAAILKNLNLGSGTLLVHQGLTEKELLSARNIEGVRLIRAADLSTLDTVEARSLLLVRDTVEALEKRLGAQG